MSRMNRWSRSCIKPDGAGTVLTLTHERLFDEESRAGHEQGWIGAFDKLEKLVT